MILMEAQASLVALCAILMLITIMLLTCCLTIITIKPLLRKKKHFCCNFCFTAHNEDADDEDETGSNATTET